MTTLAPVPNRFIQKLECFAQLSDEERTLLQDVSASGRLVGAGVELIEEGDKPRGPLLILEGMAFRYKMRASGQRQIMAYLIPGDLDDTDAALLTEMDHSIRTFSDCRVIWLTPETIQRLRQYPSIARALRMSTLVDEATLREWLLNVGGRSAIERIAHLLCELYLRLDAVGLVSELSYELPVRQADLADTTGMSSVHVNRSLMELRRKGLIVLKGRRLTITDWKGLKALAEFKANYLHIGERNAA